ncbi:MAG: ABC transporter permease [Candidatus Competibacteraceae bacterium]|uniref:ABC transporter permease n=1 Tax=Candidatus Contendibacter odensensis TaxID=1400860 RepID=UPI0004ADE851|nr:ABC transporter permease [Candidatus Contendobacter odensis]MBK8535531.1 ABC transporter permease [Candidatus Competibacteraceae bacterium]MBK8755396.1 ABC transporter permease [Candidatus Competibacteraceae bacterium]
MSWHAAPAEAWQALGANRLRTALTMLGMIIGVGAVVLMLSVGEGARSTVNQAINAMGSELLLVVPGASSASGLRFSAGTASTLTLSDAQAMTQLASLSAVAPVFPNSAQLVYGSNNWNTTVYGATPDYLTVRSWNLESGQPFTAGDVRRGARVALIGQQVASNLFGSQDPLGQTLRVKNLPFLVVGVLERKGQSLDGRDQDDAIIVPITTAQTKLFGNTFPGTVRFITAQARSSAHMADAEADITQLLRARHRLSEGEDNDFTIRNLTAIAETAALSARALAVMLGAIASVSLLVGGIGIMNIMLVSVTERTREIGIRMAIGARRRDILLQFLLEALLLCGLGGLAGAAVGVGGAWLVSELAEMTVVVTGRSIALSFLFAAGIGVFFGFYPARKAALLKPVEALRHE